MTRVRTHFHIFILGFSLLALATPAAAQDARGDFSVGWRLLRAMEAGINGEGETLPVGWYVDAAMNVTEPLAIVGEIAGAYKSVEGTESALGVTVSTKADIKIHSFMGGLRYSLRDNPRFVPFAQVLFGLAHGSADTEASVTVGGRTTTRSDSTSSNEFALSLGGGATVPVTEGLDLRLSADYIRIGADNGGNGVRVGVGVVLGF